MHPASTKAMPENSVCAVSSKKTFRDELSAMQWRYFNKQADEVLECQSTAADGSCNRPKIVTA